MSSSQFEANCAGHSASVLTQILRGAAAGAAGTTALNAVTYLDMTWRGRPASSTPEETVERVLAQTSLDLPGEGETRANRVSALGALAGLATGVAVGAAYGAVRALGVRPPGIVGGLVTTAVALAGSNAPMTAMGVTDPRSWSTADWVADVVPHLAYGLVTAWSYCAPED